MLIFSFCIYKWSKFSQTIKHMHWLSKFCIAYLQVCSDSTFILYWAFSMPWMFPFMLPCIGLQHYQFVLPFQNIVHVFGGFFWFFKHIFFYWWITYYIFFTIKYNCTCLVLLMTRIFAYGCLLSINKACTKPEACSVTV